MTCYRRIRCPVNSKCGARLHLVGLRAAPSLLAISGIAALGARRLSASSSFGRGARRFPHDKRRLLPCKLRGPNGVKTELKLRATQTDHRSKRQEANTISLGLRVGQYLAPARLDF